MTRGWAGVLAIGLIIGSPAHAGEPGSVTLVARDGKTLLVDASGMADVENDVAIDAQTAFRIASLTKQFTAVAVLLLVQDRKLSLRSNLADAMRNCPPAWRSITIEQLLSHTSGLSDDMRPILARLTEDHAPRDLVALYHARPLTSRPGVQWRYSNLNYWILGIVIEEASGMPYAAFVRSRVLTPAGLVAACYGDHAAVIPRRASGYGRNADGTRRNAAYFSSTIGYAAGGFVANGDELARWYIALSAGALLSHRLLETAATEVKTTDGNATGYALGWYVGSVCGLRALHHGGSSPGFAAYLYWIPQARLIVLTLANHDDIAEPKEAVLALVKRRLGC